MVGLADTASILEERAALRRPPLVLLAATCWVAGGIVLTPTNPYLNATKPITLNGRATGLIYDGHGAISAGAASRLLYDYAEPYRSHILDYLFKPNVGATLHMLKVEIGGDSQSSAGTEPSHMHSRGDLSCVRGYQIWMLREARRRNPRIRAFALTWALPHWVSYRDGYQAGWYDQDNIDYHISWLRCVREQAAGEVEYLGNWNQRAWGPPEWNIRLRAALDANGFSNVRIVIPDGKYDHHILEVMKTNADFATALSGGAIGIHYPCYKPHPELQEHGIKYWSSEDWFIVGDWEGASCLGRLINQNWVKNNITSTITRSLIWSTYPGLPYEARSLMLASEPWSGHFSISTPTWMLAHTTQFVEIGWTILDTDQGQQTGSSGFLMFGGSYVTYVSPERDRFTLVVEKLQGKCASCADQDTFAETLIFALAGGLERAQSPDVSCSWIEVAHNTSRVPNPGISSVKMAFNGSLEEAQEEATRLGGAYFTKYEDRWMEVVSHQSQVQLPADPGAILYKKICSKQDGKLRFWLTNKTHHFLRLQDLVVDPITKMFSFEAIPDTIYTISSTSGQASGAAVGMSRSGISASNVSASDMNDTLGSLNVTINYTLNETSVKDTSTNSVGNYSSFATVVALDDIVVDNTDLISAMVNTSENFTTMQQQAGLPGLIIPGSKPFPSMHADDFEEYRVDATPRYFVDFGGSWQVASDPIRSANQVLKQWVATQSGGNQWTADTEPITFIGHTIGDVVASVDIYMPPVAHVLTGEDSYTNIQSIWTGQCFGAAGSGTWNGNTATLTGCKPEWNQQLSYSKGTGFITASGTRKCVSAGACPSQSRSSVCFMDCCTARGPSCEGQSWSWEEDGSMNLRVDETLCLTATGMAPAGQLLLLPCSRPAPSRRQLWAKTATKFAAYAGICVRQAPPNGSTPERHNRAGYCLNLGVDINGRDVWQLERSGAAPGRWSPSSGQTVLTRGVPRNAAAFWHRLSLEARGSQLTATVDGADPVTVIDDVHSTGMLALNAGWGEAFFDNFTLTRLDTEVWQRDTSSENATVSNMYTDAPMESQMYYS